MVIFDSIFFILEGNEDKHKCLNEFEFRQDLTTDYRIICTWTSEKSTYNLVATLAPSFLSLKLGLLHFSR